MVYRIAALSNGTAEIHCKDTFIGPIPVVFIRTPH